MQFVACPEALRELAPQIWTGALLDQLADGLSHAVRFEAA